MVMYPFLTDFYQFTSGTEVSFSFDPSVDGARINPLPTFNEFFASPISFEITFNLGGSVDPGGGPGPGEGSGTVYTDNQGNYFLGDVAYDFHEINYPTVEHFKGLVNSEGDGFAAAVNKLFTDSGLEVVGDYPNDGHFYFEQSELQFDFDFRFSIDTNRRARVKFNVSGYNTTIELCDNDGTLSSTTVDNNPGYADTNMALEASLVGPAPTGPTHAATATGTSLGILTVNNLLVDDQSHINFWYVGKLVDVNGGNGGYYSSDTTDHTIAIEVIGNDDKLDGSPSRVATIHHRLNDESTRSVLTSGKAVYRIICADGQIVTDSWATDLYVFDQDVSIGQPIIGRVDNLLLGIGFYTLLKPVFIDGGTTPDNGFNRWLPIARFNNKTLLFRCYSTATI